MYDVELKPSLIRPVPISKVIFTFSTAPLLSALLDKYLTPGLDFRHSLSGWHLSVFRRVVLISSQSLTIRRPPLSSKTRIGVPQRTHKCATRNAYTLFKWLVENNRAQSHFMCYEHLVGASRRLALRLQIQPYRRVTLRVTPT